MLHVSCDRLVSEPLFGFQDGGKHVSMDAFVRNNTVFLGPKTDLHLLFQGQHWTAEYWKKHHRTVVDMCVQLGGPHLFVTIAPYGWSFPWPYWIERAQKLAHAGPTVMSGPEVLAVAHAMHQICAGFSRGSTGDGAKWKDHFFSGNGNADAGVTAYFARFEF